MDKTATEADTQEDEEDKEKVFFENKIAQLRQDLEETDRIYQQRKKDVECAKSHHESGVKSTKACVAHLKRVLKIQTERRLELQEKLQALKDKKELVDRRTSAKILEAEKIREADRSQFLQEKSELEDKLSMLEERRLKRDKQLAELEKKDKALEQKLTASYEKRREDDMRQTARLLENREKMVQKCRLLKDEWREAFQVRMPVQVKKQLEQNVVLREPCDKATEKLLQVQNENRNLKMLEKSLELEKETQSLVEDDANRKRNQQEQRLRHIFKVQQDLMLDNEQANPEKFSEKENNVLDSSATSWFLDPNSRQTKTYNPEYAEKQKQVVKNFLEQYKSWQEEYHPDDTEELKTKQYQLLDSLHDASAILEDQSRCKESLEEELNKKVEKNRVLESAILRVYRLLQTRCGKLNDDRKNVLDSDLLQQLQLLFSLASTDT